MKNRTILTLAVITLVIVIFNFFILVWMRQTYVADKATATASMEEQLRISKLILLNVNDRNGADLGEVPSTRASRRTVQSYEDL